MSEWKDKLESTMKDAEKLSKRIALVNEIIKNGGAATMSDAELTAYGNALERVALATLTTAKAANHAAKMCHAKVSNRMPNRELAIKQMPAGPRTGVKPQDLPSNNIINI